MPLLQGVCLAFMREPLIDWQREAQHVANVRLRSSRTPSNSSAAVAEAAQSEHLQLKVGCFQHLDSRDLNENVGDTLQSAACPRAYPVSCCLSILASGFARLAPGRTPC